MQVALWAVLALIAQACTPISAVPPPVHWVPSTPTPTTTPTLTPTAPPTLTLTPTTTPTPVPTATPTPAAPLAPDLELIRPIGKNYPLPPGYLPSALHTLLSYPHIRVRPGKEALLGHPEAAAWLDKLFEAAGQAGIDELYVSSAYRSMATQAYMWEKAGGSNQSRVAPPGTSEHQSGLAFDFSTGSQPWLETTDAHCWLRAHAHRFGFVNTYPRPGIDGVQAEPWHYRYVTVTVSTELHELGYLDPASTINPIEFYADLTGFRNSWGMREQLSARHVAGPALRIRKPVRSASSAFQEQARQEIVRLDSTPVV